MLPERGDEVRPVDSHFPDLKEPIKLRVFATVYEGLGLQTVFYGALLPRGFWGGIQSSAAVALCLLNEAFSVI